MGMQLKHIATERSDQVAAWKSAGQDMLQGNVKIATSYLSRHEHTRHLAPPWPPATACVCTYIGKSMHACKHTPPHSHTEAHLVTEVAHSKKQGTGSGSQVSGHVSGHRSEEEAPKNGLYQACKWPDGWIPFVYDKQPRWLPTRTEARTETQL